MPTKPKPQPKAKKPILLDQIPELQRKIAKAAQQDADRRDLAFLTDAPRMLCGVAVKALTLRHLILLCLGKSPFVCGGEVQVEHVIQFVHLVSVEFAMGNTARHREARRALMRRMLNRVKFGTAVRAIDAFLSDAWKDRPASGSVKSSPGSQMASFAASMTHEFAWAYGWTIEYTLDRPLGQLYQLLRHIAREHNPKAPLFSGAADKIKGDYLRKKRAQRKKKEGKA